MKEVKASIIIPTYGRPQNLQDVFDSLQTQIFKDFEVIIVEGQSLERTKLFVEQYRAPFRVQVIKQQGVGLANAVNEGVICARGEIVIRTDDDVIFSSEWLRAIVETFQLSFDVGGVSGPTIIPENRLRNRGLFLFFEKFINPPNIFWRVIGKIYISLIMDGQPFAVGKICKSGAFSPGSNYPSCLTFKKPIEVDYLEACNYAVRKELVEKVGGFDENYIGIGDWNEPDLCFKVRKLGYKLLFNSKAKLNHMLSTGGVFSARTQTYARSKNFVRFYFKHIKPNSLEKIFKFSVNLIFINSFFIYGFLSTRKLNQLTGLWGTVAGIIQNILGLEK